MAKCKTCGLDEQAEDTIRIDRCQCRVVARNVPANAVVTAEEAKATPLDIGGLTSLVTAVKLAHWNADTKSTEHGALGELYEALEAGTDRFVEAYLGKNKGAVEANAVKLPGDLLHGGTEAVAVLRGKLTAGEDEDLLNILADLDEALNKARYILKATEAGGGEVVQAVGTSEGARKGWEHRTREQALEHLKVLRGQGFKGRVSVEHDKDKGVYYLKKQEGELAQRKPTKALTPYDAEIRRMKRYGTSDLHGSLTDTVYSDEGARKEWEADNEGVEGASWEDAASDMAANFLAMHGLPASFKAKGEDVSEQGKVTAAGTSEGARKGWEERLLHISTQAHELKRQLEAIESGKEHSGDEELEKHRSALWQHLDNAQGRSMTLRDHARKLTRKANAPLYVDPDGNPHYASDASSCSVIHCKDESFAVKAKKVWAVGQPAEFQWMPGGTRTITASYGRGKQNVPIELCVRCDAEAAKAVQSSFEAIKGANPRRPPYGCIEHRAEERAFEPLRFSWKDDPEPAIYCECEPSELGARNVNGKIHTSFSPTFDTDAEYDTLACSGCNEGLGKCSCSEKHVFRFKTGARGSAANPARVTRLDAQSVGSLTNWPAFKDILPVAASEPQGVVKSDDAKPVDPLSTLKARCDAVDAAVAAIKARRTVEERIVDEGRVECAWSDVARAAALEARRGHTKQGDEIHEGMDVRADERHGGKTGRVTGWNSDKSFIIVRHHDGTSGSYHHSDLHTHHLEED